MRTVIAITALALSAAGAYAAEDRYGPPPAPSLVAAAGVAGSTQAARSLAPTPYSGPMLSWSGKTAPRAPAPLAAPEPPPVAARPAPFQPQASQAAPPQPQQAALPQSLYDRPMVPMSSGGPAATVQPRPATAALPPPPRPQAPQRLTAQAGEAPRAYSVMREFGGTPDPTRLPPPMNYWATRPSTAPADAAPANIDGLFEPSASAAEGPEEQDLSTGATAATRKLERRNQ